MFERGLIEEIRCLRENWKVSKTLKQAIGFQSVSNYLDGNMGYEQISDMIYDRTRNLVTKQETWFRKLPVDRWFHPDNHKEELVETVGNQFD